MAMIIFTQGWSMYWDGQTVRRPQILIQPVFIKKKNYDRPHPFLSFIVKS